MSPLGTKLSVFRCSPEVNIKYWSVTNAGLEERGNSRIDITTWESGLNVNSSSFREEEDRFLNQREHKWSDHWTCHHLLLPDKHGVPPDKSGYVVFSNLATVKNIICILCHHQHHRSYLIIISTTTMDLNEFYVLSNFYLA